MTEREQRILSELVALGWRSPAGWRGPVTDRWLVVGREAKEGWVTAHIAADGRVRQLALVAGERKGIPVGSLGVWLSQIATVFGAPSGDLTGRGGLDFVRGPGGVA